MARYLYPSLWLFSIAAAILSAGLLLELRRFPSTVAIVATTVMFAVVGTTAGLPSPSRVREAIEQKFGSATNDILSSPATVIAGDYWRVWPAVFLANLAAIEMRQRPRFNGLAYRSEPTRPQWSMLPHVCAALLGGDKEGLRQLSSNGFIPTPVQELPTASIYCKP